MSQKVEMFQYQKMCKVDYVTTLATGKMERVETSQARKYTTGKWRGIEQGREN